MGGQIRDKEHNRYGVQILTRAERAVLVFMYKDGLMFLVVQVMARVLKETPHNENNDKTNGKGGYNGNGLKAAHGIVGKDQCNGQEHEQNSPKQLHRLGWVLSGSKSLVGIGAGNHGQGVKGGCIKCYHGQGQEQKAHPRQGEGVKDGDNSLVKIPCLSIRSQ